MHYNLINEIGKNPSHWPSNNRKYLFLDAILKSYCESFDYEMAVTKNRRLPIRSQI